MVDIGTGQHGQCGALGGASGIAGIPAYGQIVDRSLEAFFDELPCIFHRRPGIIVLVAAEDVVHQGKAAQLCRHVEIDIAAQEGSFGDVLVGIRDIVLLDILDDVVRFRHDLPVLVPGVVAGITVVRQDVELHQGECVSSPAGTVGTVVREHGVVRGVVTYMQVVIEAEVLGHEYVVNAENCRVDLLFRGVVVFHCESAERALVKQVIARARQYKRCGYSEYSILFHKAHRSLKVHIHTENEGARLRVLATVDSVARNFRVESGVAGEGQEVLGGNIQAD